MNFLEELQNLDFNDIGRWPLFFRTLFVVLFFAVAASAGFYFLVYESDMPRLERVQQEEQELRLSFEQKQKKAANFDAYRQQLDEIERSFGTMLRQLPGKTEIPNLLVDIPQTGLAAGLREELFQPREEIQKDFYAEKPIRIRLSGGYHEIANFVSGIASLPRIVTLHDINITREGQGDFDQLSLEVTAQTYRYLEDSH